MAAKPKMTPEEWAGVRAAWEADPRKALPWLIQELNLPVSDEALRLRAKSEGWMKAGGAEGVKLAPKPKLGKENSKLGELPKPKLAVDSEATGNTPKKLKGDEVLAGAIVAAVGRPTLYKPEYAEQAYKLCLLGMTDAEMAEFFEVAEQTVNNWKADFPEFFESMQRGKGAADADVAHSLYRRATGCSHPDVSVNIVAGEVVLTELVRHYPPETAAAKLWLLNRQPKKWRDKVEVKADLNLNIFPPRETLDAIYEKALAEAAKRDAMLAGRRERMGIVIENGESHD